MTMKHALPLLALLLPILLLGACASKPQPIPVLAKAHQCPAYPLPSVVLLKSPAKTDFLNPTD